MQQYTILDPKLKPLKEYFREKLPLIFQISSKPTYTLLDYTSENSYHHTLIGQSLYWLDEIQNCRELTWTI